MTKENLIWCGIVLIADPVGSEYWRESNPGESEWSVSREGGAYQAGFNVSYSATGDWDHICESTGATPIEALDAARVALTELLPKEELVRAEAIELAAHTFIEAMEEADNAHPTVTIRAALKRTRFKS